eukprot:TRINITY_DN31664_c0_g1_i6.p1 TRINITY_DN31664_c0_g1~~TRINITY_DN31664_c0_g1_i6.p1  ORF type:complete len:155 (+),score=19.19 TRINITY_DN31664_c0_g1_i6:755-1219(+)
MVNDSGNGNPNQNGGPVGMPEYAHLMFENFMKAYMRRSKSRSLLFIPAKVRMVEMAQAEAVIMGAEIVRGILFTRDSMNSTLNALKRLLTPRMRINGWSIWRVSSSLWDVRNIKRLYLQHLNLKASQRNGGKRLRSRLMGKKQKLPGLSLSENS